MIHDRTGHEYEKSFGKECEIINICRNQDVLKNRNSSMNIEEFLLTLKTTNMKILTIITSVKTLIWLPQDRNLFNHLRKVPGLLSYSLQNGIRYR
jgi:hypothetical protein